MNLILNPNASLELELDKTYTVYVELIEGKDETPELIVTSLYARNRTEQQNMINSYTLVNPDKIDIKSHLLTALHTYIASKIIRVDVKYVDKIIYSVLEYVYKNYTFEEFSYALPSYISSLTKYLYMDTETANPPSLTFINNRHAWSYNDNDSAYTIIDNCLILFDCGYNVNDYMLKTKLFANVNKIFIILTSLNNNDTLENVIRSWNSLNKTKPVLIYHNYKKLGDFLEKKGVASFEYVLISDRYIEIVLSNETNSQLVIASNLKYSDNDSIFSYAICIANNEKELRQIIYNGSPLYITNYSFVKNYDEIYIQFNDLTQLTNGFISLIKPFRHSVIVSNIYSHQIQNLLLDNNIRTANYAQ